MEACFAARFPQEDTGRGAPSAQEFITKTTQELQDARAMRGDRRLPGAAPHPGEDGGLRVCIDIPGLNRAASQELFWPSRVGRCEGPPQSYVRMPFGLPNTAAAQQRLMRSILEVQMAKHRVLLEEMEMDLTEPPLRSASGPHARGAAKAHPTATFACPTACRTRLLCASTS